MFSRTIEFLATSLDWAAQRQKILTHNIANVDTPGYKRMELDFPQVLAEKLALTTTHPMHLPGTDRSAGYGAGRGRWSARVDRNDVDLDVESVRLAQNTLYYQGVAQRLTGKFQTLRKAIERR
ncbi:MAG TPA: flagellar basal body rod protein FlgB [Firmicutes bacterium]|jgi:flagellar basal-body rod protein FlgB|nr:flagellar basal body rod protein FlgB [Bacillota bacterium]